jgi:hypothetical protein
MEMKRTHWEKAKPRAPATTAKTMAGIPAGRARSTAAAAEKAIRGDPYEDAAGDPHDCGCAGDEADVDVPEALDVGEELGEPG